MHCSLFHSNPQQNQVLEESFESTKLFHQNLEDYFCAKIGEPRLYYERRNKQYSSIPTINKFQIVNLRVLTQTFVSMFLHLPYMAHRHEAKLLSEFACEDNRKIYVDNHSCTPYYICALTWYMFENAFRKNILPKKAHNKLDIICLQREWERDSRFLKRSRK